MRAAAAVAALLLLSSSIAVIAAAGPDVASAQARSAQQLPASRGPVPRPPPPPYAKRPRLPPLGSAKPRPPAPRTDPYVNVPVRLSGYANVAQAAYFAGLMSSLNDTSRRVVYTKKKGSKDLRRYKAWESNFNKTLRWNQRRDVSYARAAFNAFSDYTPGELARKLLMRGIKPQRVRQAQGRRRLAASSAASAAEQPPPEDFIDWSQRGKVPPVRNQVLEGKDCGACYAFAALAAISSKAMIEGLPSRDLSVQQILDCANNASNPYYVDYLSTSCDGGYPEEVFEYVSATGFIAREAAYPYSAADYGQCKASSASRSGAYTLAPAPGYQRVPGNNEALMRALARGPLVVYFFVEDGFYLYDSGIYQGSNCTTNTVNHAMLLIGYDSTNKYWIVRNSWGEDWGEQGNARVAMTDDLAGTCGINIFGGLQPLRTSVWQPPSPPPPSPLRLEYGFVATCTNEDGDTPCFNPEVIFTGLTSRDRSNQYSLVLQYDRNIVLYKAGKPMWTSGTRSNQTGGPYSLVLEADGNLVGYEASPMGRKAFWETGTGGRGVAPYRLVLQNNGNVVLYDSRGRPLWCTGTAQPFDHYFKRDWIGLAISKDGKQLATAESLGAWWVSSDSGRTWRNDGSSRAWAGVAMSANGSMRFAAARNDSVYFAASNWTGAAEVSDRLRGRQWSSISCSALGDQLLAAEQNGSIWKVTFNLSDRANPRVAAVDELVPAGTRNWASVAMSGDGTALLALADQGLPYYSGDGGRQWGSANLMGPFSWAGAAITDNLQVAAVRGGNILHNFNAGPRGWYSTTYVDKTGLPQRQPWSSLALAASGPSNYTLAATITGGGIQVVNLLNLSADPSGLSRYQYTPVGEVATGTTGKQMWTGVAAFPTGALVAVASRSPWGIYHSDDGRMWMPRMRGLRKQTYTNLRSTGFPIDYSKLTPAGDAVVPRPDASNVGNFTVLVFTGSLIVPRVADYDLWLTTNDVSRLEIDGNEVIQNSYLKPPILQKLPRTLSLGGWHTVRLEYVNLQGVGSLLLDWRGPGTGGRQRIPQDSLSPIRI